MARSVVFLLSPEAAGANGQIFEVGSRMPEDDQFCVTGKRKFVLKFSR
ncbi:MAG TPA: hypothetical protein VK468_04015 [Pyrinomonadaceae bacterium]|nr:hypothetical protein [Pyrinomonadaceae bacterium]